MLRVFPALWICAAVAAQTPIVIEKNLPMVEARVNGSAPLLFILDSAAAGVVIDRARAVELGLKSNGDAISSGSGGAQVVDLYDGVTLEVAGVTIKPPRAVGFDMEKLKFKRRVDGIIGHPLFSHYVVEIDYPGLKVRVWRPEEYRVPAGAEVLKMWMTIGPVVRGQLKVKGQAPIDADMQLDTGSAHVVTVCTPVVDKYKLIEAAEEVRTGSTLGFGGAAKDMVGRIEEVRVGSMVVERPEVRLSRQTEGSFGSGRHYSANLGGELFRRYKLTFDFRGGRLIVMRPGI